MREKGATEIRPHTVSLFLPPEKRPPQVPKAVSSFESQQGTSCSTCGNGPRTADFCHHFALGIGDRGFDKGDTFALAQHLSLAAEESFRRWFEETNLEFGSGGKLPFLQQRTDRTSEHLIGKQRQIPTSDELKGVEDVLLYGVPFPHRRARSELERAHAECCMQGRNIRFRPVLAQCLIEFFERSQHSI